MPSLSSSRKHKSMSLKKKARKHNTRRSRSIPPNIRIRPPPLNTTINYSYRPRKIRSYSNIHNNTNKKNERKRRNVTIRKARSLMSLRNINNIYRSISAETIGEGAFGVVSRPPSRCSKFHSEKDRVKYETKYFKNKKYISKLMDYNDAETEIGNGNLIKRTIPDWKKYYCFAEFKCMAPEYTHVQIGSDEYQDTYAIAPYCGITLKKILDGKQHLTFSQACCLLEALKYLAIGLNKLHDHQIYHNDIHDENVLYNTSDRKLRFIDFGTSTDLIQYKNNIGNNWNSDIVFVKSVKDDLDNFIYNIIKPTLAYIGKKIYAHQQTLDNKGSNLDSKLEHCLEMARKYHSSIPKEIPDHLYPSSVKDPEKYTKLTYALKNAYEKYIDNFIKDYDEDEKCKYF